MENRTFREFKRGPSRSPDLGHRNRDLTDTIKEVRKTAIPAQRIRPPSGWISVVDSSGDLPDGDPGVWNASDASGITPVFQNNWTNTGGLYPPVSFYLSDDGEIRFRGAPTGGATGTVVFTLPSGYRPEYNERLVCPTDTAGTSCIFEVSTNGDVTYIG